MILLTNDDGIRAEGIRALFDALTARNFEVAVVAPLHQNSGVGHAITIHKPIRVAEFEWPGRAYAVEGTPSDCVRLGLHLLGAENVEMVVSGINDGFNTGRFVHCSGTVSAAMEALLNYKSALAVSLDDKKNGGNFRDAAVIGADMTDFVLRNPLPAGEMLNVNVPDIPLADMRGYRHAHLGNESYVDRFYETGEGWYEADYQYNADVVADSDIDRLRQGYVTVTPLHWDMTVHQGLHERSLPEWGR